MHVCHCNFCRNRLFSAWTPTPLVQSCGIVYICSLEYPGVYLQLTFQGAGGVLFLNGDLIPPSTVQTNPNLQQVDDVDAVQSPVDLAKRWNPETAVYILANVGDEFCELKEQASHNFRRYFYYLIVTN